jgi:DNA-directed RNA polymerase subunit M/transcription elongation factor TFIIS
MEIEKIKLPAGHLKYVQNKLLERDGELVSVQVIHGRIKRGYGDYLDIVAELAKEQQKIKKTLEQRETIASVGAPQQFIKCLKCKSDHVDVEQKQTRSADEPMTLFCQCRDCGTRFVMS